MLQCGEYGWSRKKTATVLCVVGCAFSFVLTSGISSYLVGIVDSFVNEFGILILIAVQSVIFGWIYGADKLLDVLNGKSLINVGGKWMFIIRYLLPCFLAFIWVIGIVKLFSTAKTFEIIIDVIIIVGVMASAIALTKINGAND